MRTFGLFSTTVLVGVALSVLATTGGARLDPSTESACLRCHREITPGIVGDWEASRHFEEGIVCSDCHGDRHQTADDVDAVDLPTPETCATCHDERVEQYKAGKHALAWAAMKAMPTVHSQPMALTDGMKGCGGCHKIGLKSKEDIRALKAAGVGFGVASCDACHTRHTFSRREASQPQACQTCHMGFDHPQWEMYASSKHGVRFLLKQNGVLPESASAPTCQTCHMPDGNHAVKTAWGFLAVRLPMPDDEQWTQDRTTILQALNVLDPLGNTTERFTLIESADVARLTEEDWQALRDRMITTCSLCHSEHFAKAELERGDRQIREADHLMAEAIRIVAKLYEDDVVPRPSTYDFPFPDLLAFFDAPTVIEQKLFKMFMEHRMRAFQGVFHASPDYALWYGWSEMVQDLTEIREEAERMRR